MELQLFNDQMLIQEIKAGNELAFNELFARYEKYLKIWTFYFMNDREPVQEITHEVIFSIWQRRENISIRDVAAYLYGAIKKCCAYKIRALKYYRKKVHLVDFFGIDIHSDNVSELSRKEFYATLYYAIEHISAPSSREAFEMHILDDIPQKEIATKMNTTEGAIKQKIHRAAKIVRPFMEIFR